MSEEYLAGVGLRVTQVATRTGVGGNALTNLNAAEYPNGSLAVVAQENSLYMLDKGSTIVADGISVIAAVGGGRWIAVSSGEKALYSAMARLLVDTGTPSTGAMVQNTWKILPGATSQYAYGGTSPTSLLWSINTTSGVLTYSGPQRQFMIFGSATLSTGAGTMALSFSHSANPIIGTTDDSDFESQYTVVSGNEVIHLSFIGLADIAPTETIQGTVRNLEDGTSMGIERYQLAIIPAP